MICGLSHDWHEFYTPYRVANRIVCNGCYSDIRVRALNDFCPYQKNTARELECQKKISPRQVINAIERLILDRNLTPPIIGKWKTTRFILKNQSNLPSNGKSFISVKNSFVSKTPKEFSNAYQMTWSHWFLTYNSFSSWAVFFSTNHSQKFCRIYRKTNARLWKKCATG